jgi:dTDP-glucose 4,6-dehydratase
MQAYLVTGGMGFIGSHFIEALLAAKPDAAVVNLDVLTYAGNPQNLAHLQATLRYRFIRGDIADFELVGSLLEQFQFAAVINFAAESFVDRSIESSAPFVHSNIAGVQVLLDAVREYGCPRYLQVSTDEVYGSLGQAGEFTEASPLKPNNPYSASKAGADLLCRAYFVTHKTPVLVTRCSNNYGPRQFPEKLIPLFIAKALRDETLPVYGDGLHVRDWLHVTDHCSAILAVLDQGEPGEVYNVGGGTELPNIELVRLLLAKLGKPESLINHVPDRPGHDRRYALNHDKLTAATGWRPAVPFTDGLARTVDWYLANSAWLDAIRGGSYQAGY